MNTRSKFKCVSVTKRQGWSGIEFIWDAEFSVVQGSEPGDENKEFFASTPSGNIKIGTIREDHFEVGKFYYVDFTMASE